MSGKISPSSENNILISSTPFHAQSVETDADRLMDDLFSDIDRILEGGSQLPSEPIHPDYIALKSVVVPSIVMPPPANQSAIITQDLITQSHTNQQILFNGKFKKENDNLVKKDWGYYFDKILFVVACLTLFGVVGWLIYQRKIQIPFLVSNNPETVVNNAQISPEDSQFIAYMLRSLEVIDSQTVTSNNIPPTATTNIPPTVTLPPVAPPSNPNQPQTVVERIYIPYPSGQMPSGNTPQPQNNPSVLPAPSAVNPPPSQPIPTPPVTATPLQPPVNQSIPNLDFNVPPPPLPGVTHTLVGLLEAGDNSAALFDVNGSTQRIKVGEQIGTSGWALVSVASQQAVIRRNGEVRSIYVGQKF
jgi:hypothetical protein